MRATAYAQLSHLAVMRLQLRLLSNCPLMVMHEPLTVNAPARLCWAIHPAISCAPARYRSIGNFKVCSNLRDCKKGGCWHGP